YEWRDEYFESHYTDYIIASEEGTQFSAPGDSGKLIVTADNLEPIALLWGGDDTIRTRKHRHKEDFTFAIDINIVLDRLKLAIVR
ncbi:MAG: hypothetical protein MJA32_15255, partial [Proteobacteria bacterium]|nr:hypothetical protein [Pseudomonadota bacterium]